MNPAAYHRSLHLMALCTAAVTFPLIFMGGLVTSHSAGMSVPDWPNSYGYNMFLFPPHLWVGGILYEHVHRLMATVVGLCAIILTLIAWGPGQTVRRRNIILVTLVILTLCNALITVAMVKWPARFHLSADVSHASIELQAVVVGVAIALLACMAMLCQRTERRRWVRWLATFVLGMVIFQGVLGGLRVVLVNVDLAIVHACVAQAFFCLTALVCVVTSRWWIMAPDLSGTEPRLLRMAIACVVMVYGQLIVGAVMRHNQAGLAIPDFPFVYNSLLPPTDSDELAATNAQLQRLANSSGDPRDRDLPTSVTMFQVWINFTHRIGALLIAAVVSALFITIFESRDFYPDEIKRPVYLLLVLLATQITLGVCTVLLRKPADVASTHVAVGALVLVTSFILWVRGLRMYSSAFRKRLTPPAKAAPTRPVAAKRTVPV